MLNELFFTGQNNFILIVSFKRKIIWRFNYFIAIFISRIYRIVHTVNSYLHCIHIYMHVVCVCVHACICSSCVPFYTTDSVCVTRWVVYGQDIEHFHYVQFRNSISNKSLIIMYSRTLLKMPKVRVKIKSVLD